MLDGFARRSLRTLNRENADVVARHLVASGLAVDGDPELAYRHALAAQHRAGRVDVVREAVATTAYLTGRYAVALREARTMRRLSGDDYLRAIEADSERGLGRPDRALAVIGEVDVASQPATLRTELAIVASGARADLGEFEAGLLAVEEALKFIRDREMRSRLLSVKADRLDDLGRSEEAARAREEMDSLDTGEDEESVLYIDDALDPELELAVQLEEADEGGSKPGDASEHPEEALESGEVADDADTEAIDNHNEKDDEK
ncbi:MAG TPA: hypothetical protein VFC82_02845 [Actinomycetaceae bacterium]|nr:hypothetical protein [Actinomycetaceae bacterium]